MRGGDGCRGPPLRWARSPRLLKSTREPAVDDELIRRNPCGISGIKGAGKEKAAERPIATMAKVDASANQHGPRWRLMVFLGM